MDINCYIDALVSYSTDNELIEPCDRIWCTNALIDLLGLDSFENPHEKIQTEKLADILGPITDYAVSKGICGDTITERDLFDTRVMGIFVAKPSEVRKKFAQLYKQSPELATQYLYKLSMDSNYIRRDRICKDKKWSYVSKYGKIDITINLSKPEKDPKEIAKLKDVPSSSYPKCALCVENEGYAGNLKNAARQNLRPVPVMLDGTQCYMQYSPYVYYNEHCIVFSENHSPMKIEKETFDKLLEFVEMFPHYILGSNADLPLVGGSILSHEHFQGGCYEFPQAKAKVIHSVVFEGYEDVSAGIVDWAMSVIRLSSASKESISRLGGRILSLWQQYTDEESFIFSHTGDEPHNTITPIARKNGDVFELDLVFRNNITTDEYPLGMYHPHSEVHNIKKENIGLIEVMGLAILPARLLKEMQDVASAIISGDDISKNPSIEKHAQWVADFIGQYPDINKDNVNEILEKEIAKTFVKGLEQSAVFKSLDSFKRFIDYIKNGLQS